MFAPSGWRTGGPWPTSVDLPDRADRPPPATRTGPTLSPAGLGSAKLFLSALGVYEARVNGEVVEYAGVVEENRSAVTTVRRCEFVSAVVRLGQHLRDLPVRLPVVVRTPGKPPPAGAHRPKGTRAPLADGTVVATPGMPTDLVPSLLDASEALGAARLLGLGVPAATHPTPE